MRIIRSSPSDLLTCENALRLFKRKLSAFDMRRIVRLKHEGALLHTGNPVLGKFGRVQKSTRPFDPCQLRRDRIRYLKLRCKAHLLGHIRTQL